MKICIICRELKEDFNDEHVIPDSIQGYYHIYSVCTDCNSKLGSNIDKTLTNHKFIEFQRFLLNIKGKASVVPNPFKGVHYVKDQPEQKVSVEVNEDRKIIPYFLPIIPDLKSESLIDSFTIVVDKRDEKNIDKIVKKILKRNGIDESKITSSTSSEKTQPLIHTKLKIDLHDFKAGMLKIAYEFAVDSIPEYFNDPLALKISNILHSGNIENLASEITFFGNGFDKLVLQPFENLIDFDNNNHYLILTSFDSKLICFINLFNTFSIGILISTNSNYLENNIIIGKNDLELHSFKKYDIYDILQSTYTPIEYRFQHWFSSIEELTEFKEMQNGEDFGYFYENEKIAFYDKNGTKLYENIDLKLNSLNRIHKGDVKTKMISEFILDEDLYIKLLPSMKLYKIVSVQIERYRTNKI